MRHGTTYLSAIGLALGQAESVEHAVQTGQLSPAYAAVTDQRSVAVAGRDCASTALAANAALDALDQARVRHPEIGPVYHAVTTPTNGDGHNPAADVLARVGLDTSRHPTQTIANGRQGVIDALAAAATYLEQPYATGTACALVTAGDTWSGAASDRWAHTTPRGDGGGALVLTTAPAKAALIATATRTDATLGGLRRHGGPAHVIDSRLHRLLLNVANDALADARLAPTDVTCLVSPLRSDSAEHAAFLRDAKIDDCMLAPLVERRREIGHLGATDLIAALHWLDEAPVPVSSGDHVLLLAHSGGASAGAAVIEIR